MNVTLTITGRSCDLALHPVSPRTALAIRAKGRKIYAEKYMDFWRRGNTRNFGMRIEADTKVQLSLDGSEQTFDMGALLGNVSTSMSNLYLDSKAKYLAVMGFAEEVCSYTWTWNNVESFDAARFMTCITDFGPVLGSTMRAIDEVRYDTLCADDFAWGNPGGFTLIDPVVLDLDQLRRVARAA
ncbi:MAG: hypothetical protein LBU75_06770 [Desulfovibrio sp.]|jgi:hypothetical protein|nr:hypothetical protein [Desulfovibrio sp.]